MRTVDDLFSCIGGHALGLHATGKFRTIRFVEIDRWRREQLVRHFPDVPIHGDARTAGGITADLLVGGPPCKQTSTAAAIHGRRTGESLWGEMRRIADEGQYDWICVEQPPGNLAWEAKVTSDLEALGYRVARLEFSAADLGAPHLRRRMFLLAHGDRERLALARQAGSREIERYAGGTAAGNPWIAGIPGDLRVDYGVPGGLDRRKRIAAIGDSNPPGMMTVIGRMIMAADLSDCERPDG